MKIIGSYVSPYVRKVLVCMELKGLDYEVDPITPFFGNDEFRRLSPLCRIPVLIDGDLVLTNSTVIAEYLDEAYPEPPLLPREPKERARARWLEEFADTRLGDVFIWGLFYPKIRPPECVERARRPGADRAGRCRPTSPLRSIIWKANCRTMAICSARSAWPTSPSPASSATAPMPASRSMPIAGRRPPASSTEVLSHPAFEKLHRLEQIQLGTSIQGRRQALLDAGARLTAETYGEREPRKGVMRL